MSWLGGRLSQFSSLTDQISSFTKEVLTETTEEVEDPAAELQVARKKISDLESLNRHIQTEWEKLKAHRDELNEQAETAEYQIATISQEYRKVFQEKDSELRRLKTENQSLKEQQKRLIPQDDSGTLSPLKELAKPRFSHSNELHQKEISFGGGDGVGDRGLGDAGDVVMVDGWGEEFHDFGDVVSSQSEINQLQSELGSLKVECQHWKAVAQEKMSSTHSEGSHSGDDSVSLREQIKELQHSLQLELEQHQRELTALQTVHSQRLQSLSQRHQREVEQLQQQLQEMREDLAAGRGGSEDRIQPTEDDHQLAASVPEPSPELKTSLEESQTRCANLESEVLQLQKTVADMEGGQPLSSELETLQESKTSLEEVNMELSKRLAALEEEKKMLDERVSELVAMLEETREEREREEGAQKQRGRLLGETLHEQEQLNKDLREQLEHANSRNTALHESNTQLVSKLKEEQLTTTRLHEEIGALKQQITQEKDAQIHLLEDERERLVSNLSQMQSSIAEHEESVSRLQEQHGRSHKEVEALNSQVEGLILEVKSKEVEIAALKERTQPEGEEDLQAESEVQLGEKTSAVDSRQVIEQLKAELLKQRAENEELSKELSHFRGGGDVLLARIGQEHGDSLPMVNETGAEGSTKELELKLHTESQKCERLQTHLAQVTEEYDVVLSQLLSEREGLEEKVTTLRERLDSTLLTRNDATFRSNELELENSQLSEEISQLKETTSKLEMELENLRVSQNDRKLATATETCAHQETSHFEDVDLDSYQQLPTGSEVDSQFVERFQSLEAEIERKDNIITVLEASAANSEALRKSLEGSLAQMGREKEELEKEAQYMVAEYQQLQSDLQEHKDKRDTNQQAPLQEFQQREEQLRVELERLKSERSEKEVVMLQLQRQQEESLQAMRSHEQNLQELRDVLSQREGEISELRTRCKEGKASEEMLTSKCSELESRSQEEKAALLERLACLEQEAKLAHSEHQAATGIVGEAQSSLHEVQSSLEQRSRELSQVVSDRDSLKASLIAREEEIGQLSDELGRTKQELNHEVASLRTDNEKLLQELSVLRPEASSLTSARKQLQLRVEVLEGDYDALQREMEEKLAAKQAECVRYTKELSRLKKHLVEVEEQYTQEALRADEEATRLKQQIFRLEDKLQNSNMAGQVQSQHTQQQLEDLREQLHVMAAQRDDAFLHLASAQEEAERNAEALHNLQTVLEQFERDQASELSVALKHSQMELADALKESERWRREQRTVLSELEEVRGAAEAAGLLGQELEERERKIAELTGEVEKLRATLGESQLKMEALSRDLVDRGLVKNLVLGYLHAPDRKKPEVLGLISKILGFTPEELYQAQGGGSSWMSGWWRRTPSTLSQPGTKEVSASLSQLFIKFLEAESTPPQTPVSPNIPSSVIGYVDPRSDPDRPSLATAAIIGQPPPRHSHPHLSTSSSGQCDDHLPLHTSLPTFQSSHKSVIPSTSEATSRLILTPVVSSSSRLHSEQTHTPSPSVTIAGTVGVPIHESSTQPTLSIGQDGRPSDHMHRQHPPLAPTDIRTEMPFRVSPPTSHPSATSNRRADTSSLFLFSPGGRTRDQSFQSSLLKNVLSD